MSLVLIMTSRVGQTTTFTVMATENCFIGARDPRRVTAPSWRNIHTMHSYMKAIHNHICFSKRYSANYYRNKANFLSNPDVKFMGKKTGSSSEDNARVFTETRFRSAAVGDESATISEYLYSEYKRA